jgi:hypothetical protein
LKRLSKGLDMPPWQLLLLAEEIEKADEDL